MGAFLDFAHHAEAIHQALSGAPDRSEDTLLLESYPATWQALHDRRQTRPDRVSGLGMQITLEWTGMAYSVSLSHRRYAMKTRLTLHHLLELPEALERALTEPQLFSWEKWEPFKDSVAGKELAQARQKLTQTKKS